MHELQQRFWSVDSACLMCTWRYKKDDFKHNPFGVFCRLIGAAIFHVGKINSR